MEGHGQGGYVIAAEGRHPLVDPAQRSRAAHGLPSRLNQHGPGMRATLLGDAAVVGTSLAGLMHARVKADVGHQLVWRLEPRDRSDRRGEPDRHHHVDAGDGHQPLYVSVGQGIAGKLALDNPQVVAEAVILAHVSLQSLKLVLWKMLRQEPCPSLDAKQVGMRTLRHEVSVQEGLRDRLQPRPLADDLVAPGYLPP